LIRPTREAAIAWIVANQIGRRNLTPSQRTPVGVELEKQLAVEAKKRRGMRTDLVEQVPPSDFGKARDKAAKMLGINPHYITDAKKIEREAVLGLSLLLWGKLRLLSFLEDARHERQQLFRGREVFSLARIDMLHPAFPLSVLHLCVRMELHDERALTGQGRLIFVHA
jgi:hypothetical protein